MNLLLVAEQLKFTALMVNGYKKCPNVFVSNLSVLKFTSTMYATLNATSNVTKNDFIIQGIAD